MKELTGPFFMACDHIAPPSSYRKRQCQKQEIEGWTLGEWTADFHDGMGF